MPFSHRPEEQPGCVRAAGMKGSTVCIPCLKGLAAQLRYGTWWVHSAVPNFSSTSNSAAARSSCRNFAISAP